MHHSPNWKNSTALRVLHAIPSLALHHGGPSQSVAGLINAMGQIAPDDLRISLICGQAEQEPILSGIADRILVRYASQRFWCPAPRFLAPMQRAVRLADVVHVHSYWNGFASIMIGLARRENKPVVLSPRGSLQVSAMAQSSARAKALFAALGGRRQLRGLSGCLFQTETEARVSYGVSGKPSVIIDNGVALPKQDTPHDALRAKLFADTSDALNLVFLGRIARIKGIGLQVQALRHLRDRKIRSVLHLVGPDGGDLARIQAMAHDMGLKEYVKIHGPVYGGEKHDWLRAADAVLITSEFENNSNAALEAMAAGGVLIATDGSLADGPVRANAAIRVRRNAQAVAKAIVDGPAQNMRVTARAYVNTMHDWPSRAARMLEFYESLL